MSLSDCSSPSCVEPLDTEIIGNLPDHTVGKTHSRKLFHAIITSTVYWEELCDRAFAKEFMLSSTLFLMHTCMLSCVSHVQLFSTLWTVR